MSAVSGMIFGLSDYAYEFTGIRRNSYAADAIAEMRGQTAVGDSSGCGCCGGGVGCACSGGGGCRMSIKPRIDEYIPSFPRTMSSEQNNEDNLNSNADDTNINEEQSAQAAPLTALGAGDEQYSQEEREAIEKLAARDREVRAHEQAHVAAGGAYVMGGPTYSYETGPDGMQYAVGGEVKIDVSPVSGDPDATIRKMQTVIVAAMAPANPSSADIATAAQASKTQASARAEAAEQAREEAKALTEDNSPAQQPAQTQSTEPDPTSGQANGENNSAPSSVQPAEENTNEVQNQMLVAINAYTNGGSAVLQAASAINFVA